MDFEVCYVVAGRFHKEKCKNVKLFALFLRFSFITQNKEEIVNSRELIQISKSCACKGLLLSCSV